MTVSRGGGGTTIGERCFPYKKKEVREKTERELFLEKIKKETEGDEFFVTRAELLFKHGFYKEGVELIGEILDKFKHFYIPNEDKFAEDVLYPITRLAVEKAKTSSDLIDVLKYEKYRVGITFDYALDFGREAEKKLDDMLILELKYANTLSEVITIFNKAIVGSEARKKANEKILEFKAKVVDSIE